MYRTMIPNPDWRTKSFPFEGHRYRTAAQQFVGGDQGKQRRKEGRKDARKEGGPETVTAAASFGSCYGLLRRKRAGEEKVRRKSDYGSWLRRWEMTR